MLALIDVSALFTSLLAACIAASALLNGTDTAFQLGANRAFSLYAVVVALTLFSFTHANLYREREERASPDAAISAVMRTALVGLVLVLYARAGVDLLALALATPLAAITIDYCRTRYEEWSARALRASGVRRRAILIASSSELSRAVRELGPARDEIEYEVIGYVALDGPDEHMGSGAKPRPDADIRFLGRIGDLQRILERYEPLETILMDGKGRLLRDARQGQAFRETIVRHNRVSQFQTKLFVPSPAYAYNGLREQLQLIQIEPRLLNVQERFIKRCTDLVCAMLGILALLPVWVSIAAFLAVTRRGRVFKKEMRMGYMGRPYGLWRFNWTTRPKPEFRDRRATALSQFLRGAPQFWNVLRGDMSIVGPLSFETRTSHNEGAPLRQLVRPGMTGICQLAGSKVDRTWWVKADSIYLNNWTFGMDLRIIVKTLLQLVRRRDVVLQLDRFVDHRDIRIAREATS